MGFFGELLKGLQRGSSAYGSVAAPPPMELPVPADLRRAVDRENLRRAKAKEAADRVREDDED